VSTLLVASGGGHLEELWQLHQRLPLDDDVLWVTTDSPQSRSLLHGQQRLFAPAAAPRDAKATVAISKFARHIFGLNKWDSVVSTGPLMAVPFMSLARLHRAQAHFIESCARVSGPSLSAQLIERIPGMRCYSPYPWWKRPGWEYRGSVLDGFEPSAPVDARLRRVVVMVGTNVYGFRELLNRLIPVLPTDCEILWQTGTTNVRGLPIEPTPFLPESTLSSAIREADLVISHAGVGSALLAMKAGHAPLLVPRSARRGEHVDDHQQQVASELDRRGLATIYDLDSPKFSITDAIYSASSSRVNTVGNPQPFQLADA
jgi:UDP-N-acetylglucosamine--N-acetylmuramyl-(pentapeptide) pyrophosphoryl-undecaprenol N-acetylglucosamine transferase